MTAIPRLGLLILLFTATQAAEPPKPRAAQSPEEALKLLGEAGKHGNLEAVRAHLSDHDRILLDAMVESEKAVAELENALQENFGKRPAKFLAASFFPGPKEGEFIFEIFEESLQERLKFAFGGIQDRPIISKDLKADGSVILTLKAAEPKDINRKFTAVKDANGWRLLMWIGAPDGGLIEPPRKLADLCKKRSEEAAADISSVARQVKDGKIRKYADTWPAIADRWGAPEVAKYLRAEPQPQPLKDPIVLVHVGTTMPFQAITKKFIKDIVNESEQVVRVSVTNDPATLMLTGVGPGKSRLKITDIADQKETLEVVVRRLIELPVGVEDILVLPDPIGKIVNENDKVAKATLLPTDASRIRIEAMTVGRTLCTLTQKAGKQEDYDIIVVKPDRAIAVGQSELVRPASMKGLKLAFSERMEIAGVGPGEVKPIKGVTGRLELIVDRFKPAEIHTAEGEFISISIKALRVGVTRVTLIDTDGKNETLVIGVVPKK